MKDHEKWRIQTHHQVAFRAPKFSSIHPAAENRSSCSTEIHIPELDMPIEAGPTNCLLVDSVAHGSLLYAKVDLKSLPIRIQSLMISPRSELAS